MRRYLRTLPATLLVLFAASVIGSRAVAGDDDNVLKNLHTVSTLASTLPANQDVNPYGVAEIQRTVGKLTQGAAEWFLLTTQRIL